MKNEFDPMVESASVESANAKEVNEVKHWLEEVTAAEKREKSWRDEAHKVIRLYEADKQNDYQFNILYSNTETLAPALYSTTPTPVVERRFKDDDPVGLAASKVTERTLMYSMDNGQAIYPPFDKLMSLAVLSGLVPGRGVTRFKYDAEIVAAPKPEAEAEDSTELDDNADRSLPGTAEEQIAAGAQIAWEAVCGEQIQWDRFCHGYGATWQDVPWIAYKWPMVRQELIKNFGFEVGNAVIINSVSAKEMENQKDPSVEMLKGMKIAWVYEIWDKRTKQVIFISEGYKEGPMKKIADPLQLTGFFNCPEPLKFFDRVSSLMPQTLYSFYSAQATELNRVTARIGRLIAAMKVRGIYDGSIDALSRIFAEDDNALLAADNTAAMYDRGGIEKAIWLLPIDKIITVLAQLYIARQQTKQVIYEVTGLSDILRGTSNPNETLGAQKIKDQWGNLRLRKLQRRVQVYVVDCLRIMAEIACTKFGQDTLTQITNLKYPSMQEKQAAGQQMMAVQQQGMQPSPDGQPPAPPDPAMMEQITNLLSQPSWEEIMQVLQNDLQRSYKITIETNSTIEPEATEDKESMMGLMNALSQFLLGVQPLVENGSLPFEAMKAMMLTICRRFNFGDQVEDELKKMKAPEPKADPEAEKKEAELAQREEELAKQSAQMQIDAEKAQLQQQYDAKVAEMQKQLEAAQADFARAKAENDMEAERKAFEAEMRIQQVIFDIQLKAKDELARIDRENDNRVAELRNQVTEGMNGIKQGQQQDRADEQARQTAEKGKKDE